jgi:hypothetical protein
LKKGWRLEKPKLPWREQGQPRLEPLSRQWFEHGVLAAVDEVQVLKGLRIASEAVKDE